MPKDKQPEGWSGETCNDQDEKYTNFNLLNKLPPIWSHIMEIFCLLTLIFFQWMRNQYRNFDPSSKLAWKMQKIMTVASLVDIILFVMIINPLTESKGYPYPWIAAFIRPFYIIVTIRLIREYWNRYLLVMMDSMPMVAFIIVYILYFSWMGQRLFSGTLEGVQYFASFGDSCFNMLVLMTTSNYPDVMLPSYQIFRLNCLYFIIYLVVGLFLLMNLLLAIFYSNFKHRFEDAEELTEDQSHFLYEEF